MKMCSRLVMSKVLPAVAVASAMALGTSSASAGSYFSEEFNSGFITAGSAPSGWVTNNLSDPPGNSWFQGSPTVFGAASGLSSDSYVGSNFNAVDTGGVISNWLITPPITAPAGARVSFLTRSPTGSDYPDRLQLRYATTDTTNVGTASSDVGDFGSLLVEVNPGLAVGGYPETWTTFQATLPSAMSGGRLAFRYFVDDGGLAGSQSDYIGIDFLNVTDAADPLPTPVPPPSVPPPASISTVVGGSLSTSIAGSQVIWYKFVHAGGAINLNTLSTLDDLDTEIGLYGSSGNLIASSDDASSTTLFSQISGTLNSGTYYLALSQYNATFGANFVVTSNATDSGTVVLSGLSLAPTLVKGDFGGAESSNGSFNTPDGTFDALDVEGFLLALNASSSYLALNPTLTAANLVTLGDFGGAESIDGSFNTPDGSFDSLDVEGFLLALNNPSAYASIQPPGSFSVPGGLGRIGSPVPEPTALGLLVPAAMMLGRRRR